MKPLHFFLVLAMVVGFMGGIFCKTIIEKHGQQQIAFDSRPYVNGEVLLPDYVHGDTLVVLDAYNLNKVCDGVDSAITTDEGIDSVLHLYCGGYNFK